MKQSDRMRWYQEYQNHPFKNEYLKEKSKIKSRRLPAYDRFIIALCTIPFILIFVIGYLFFKDVYFIDGLGSIGHTLLYIAVGIGNIVLCLYILSQALEYGIGWEKTDEFEKLQDKYKEKGLLEVDDPFKAECSEYDDISECTVCSATREPLLSIQEIRWCKTSGNCKKCAKFISAMGYDPKRWDEQFHCIEKW